LFFSGASTTEYCYSGSNPHPLTCQLQLPELIHSILPLLFELAVSVRNRPQPLMSSITCRNPPLGCG
jgi:hypothetical protein